jgi:hypothetical protein
MKMKKEIMDMKEGTGIEKRKKKVKEGETFTIEIWKKDLNTGQCRKKKE